MHIDLNDYLPRAEILFNEGPVALVYSGGECYVELIVQDFVDSKAVSMHVFDGHDAQTMRELGQALIKWADSIDEVWSGIEEHGA